MPDTKISGLAAILGADLADGDLFPAVDISDATMAASGTNKKITRAQLAVGLGVLTQAGADALYAALAHTHTFASLTSKPTTLAGYGITDNLFDQADADALYSALAHVHTFASLTSKPTTVAGYGITDAFTQAAADALYSVLAHTHTFASLTSKPTTLAGYGITDASAVGHVHAAADVTSGVFANARIATGTPDGTKFLRDDQVWTAVSASDATKLPLAGGTMTGTLVTRGISVQSTGAGLYSYPILIGAYGSISETGGGLAYITGNSVKAHTVDSQIVKTTNDPGHFIRMRYDKGISFHTDVSGVIGTAVADNNNQRLRINTAGVLIIAGTTVEDIGIVRNAAGVLEVNSGTTGTFRDIKVRDVIINGATNLLRTSAALTDNAGALTGTLGNSPVTGNPTKWVRIDDNGTARFLPLW